MYNSLDPGWYWVTNTSSGAVTIKYWFSNQWWGSRPNPYGSIQPIESLDSADKYKPNHTKPLNIRLDEDVK